MQTINTEVNDTNITNNKQTKTRSETSTTELHLQSQINATELHLQCQTINESNETSQLIYVQK